MRLLLDESPPRKLKAEFTGHDVQTVVEMGWGGVQNGELLRQASQAFDVLITADQNLPSQQRLLALPLAVIVLRPGRIRIDTLRSIIPAILACLDHIQPRSLHMIP
ncbi:DUF5615 family PIN-like protein [Massilia sp. MB5]|uniref:DUF5615 family PIN-like protein n=1 Tax=Massilia sp. MB5 TaxID=2919578 RepID=UPI0035A30534